MSIMNTQYKMNYLFVSGIGWYASSIFGTISARREGER
jgi:hypothetical protein